MHDPSAESAKLPLKLALALEYPIDLQGGVSVVVRGLILELCQTYEIYLVSPDTVQEAATSSIKGCIAGHIQWNPSLAGIRSAKRLASRLATLQIDIAHFHFGGNYGWGSRFFEGAPLTHAARRGIAVFSTVHSVVGPLVGYCGPEKPLFVKLALLPLAWAGKMNLLCHVRKEIAASQHDWALLRRWYWPFSWKFVQVYHSRIEEVPARKPTTREELIVNVGHIAGRKGQAVLVEAFGRIAMRHPSWRLALVGPIGERAAEEEIRRLIEVYALEQRVLLVGTVADPTEWLRRAAIYVQPSFEEALGLALQEAMFYECACIGTMVGGIRELITPGTGVLIPARDSNSLALQLELLISSPMARKDLGRSAAESIRSRGMTRRAMAARHVLLYDGVG